MKHQVLWLAALLFLVTACGRADTPTPEDGNREDPIVRLVVAGAGGSFHYCSGGTEICADYLSFTVQIRNDTQELVRVQRTGFHARSAAGAHFAPYALDKGECRDTLLRPGDSSLCSLEFHFASSMQPADLYPFGIAFLDTATSPWTTGSVKYTRAD